MRMTLLEVRALNFFLSAAQMFATVLRDIPISSEISFSFSLLGRRLHNLEFALRQTDNRLFSPYSEQRHLLGNIIG